MKKNSVKDVNKIDDEIMESDVDGASIREADDIEENRVQELEAQLSGAIDAAQRLQAEFDNYRKRNAKLRAEAMEEGAENVLRGLLVTLDNFERALSCADTQADGFIEGVEMVYKQLVDELAKHGLSEVDTSGMFDPHLHEAVMQDDSGEHESGKITNVLQKGFQTKNRVIRHAMVTVAK